MMVVETMARKYAPNWRAEKAAIKRNEQIGPSALDKPKPDIDWLAVHIWRRHKQGWKARDIAAHYGVDVVDVHFFILDMTEALEKGEET